jgi:hypothetical protein
MVDKFAPVREENQEKSVEIVLFVSAAADAVSGRRMTITGSAVDAV